MSMGFKIIIIINFHYGFLYLEAGSASWLEKLCASFADHLVFSRSALVFCVVELSIFSCLSSSLSLE